MSSGTVREVARRLGDKALLDWPLGPLTTYRVGGRAAVFVEAASAEELQAVKESVAGTEVEVLVIGRGSNLLVADGGFPGVAVCLGEGFGWVELEGEVLKAGGGAALPVLARRAVAAGLTGMEWAVGVPGSVGGAVRMNAGGHGSDTSQVLTRARLVDLSGAPDVTIGTDELDFGYRHSAVLPHQVVVWAEFQLGKGERERSERELAEIVRWRRDNQPGGQNAGSVFTNPPGDSAGRLVEAAGLKGYRVGSAQVSTKHANFIQADAGGSADDVIRLITEVRRMVADRTGVLLDIELKVVGPWGMEGAEGAPGRARGGAGP